MKNLINFTKWRALLAGMLLAAIAGFLYGSKTASEGVLIILSVSAVLHISLFYHLLLKSLASKNSFDLHE